LFGKALGVSRAELAVAFDKFSQEEQLYIAAGRGDQVAEVLAMAHYNADRAAAERKKLRRAKRLVLRCSRFLKRRVAKAFFDLLRLREL
jgi:hypothetical protein